MSRVAMCASIVISLAVCSCATNAAGSPDGSTSQYLDNVTIRTVADEKIVLNEVKKDTEITIGLNVRWSYRPGFLKTRLRNIATVSVFDTKSKSSPVHKFEFVDGSVIIGSLLAQELVGRSEQGRRSIRFDEVTTAALQPIQERDANSVPRPAFSVTYGTEYEGFREQTVNLETAEFGYRYSRIIARSETGVWVQGSYFKRLPSIPFEGVDGVQLSVPLKDVVSLELDLNKDQGTIPLRRVLTYRQPGSDGLRKIAGKSRRQLDKDESSPDAEGYICGSDWRGTWQLGLDMVVALRGQKPQPSAQDKQ